MLPEDKAKQMENDLKAADKARKDAEEAEARSRADADDKLDKLLAHLDSLGKRMDAYEARRKDEDGEDDDEIEEKGDPKKLGADSSRKDSVRADSAADLEEIENHKLKVGPTYKVAADSVIAEIQTQADRAATAWGKDAKHPWDGEGITAYRRRVAREHQKHSNSWKDVDLNTLAGQSLRNAVQQIFADSIAASSSPESYPDTLIERHVRDPISGQKRIEFYGSPSAWTNQFKGGAMRVTAFRTPGWRQG
jgi:hypothetical protein